MGFVTHEMNNVSYLSSEYATVDEEGRVIYEKEGESLCLINTEVLMFRDGKIIFNGSDERLRSSDDEYIQRFIHGHKP